MKQDKQLRLVAGGLKRTARALLLASISGLPLAAWSQAIPFEAEGRVTQIETNSDGSVNLTVFGRKFHIPSAATIHTPTATLTLEQLADPTRFPGRVEDGFLGGTAILIGEVIDIDGVATPLINDVEIEPAETVLLGTLTKNEGGSLALLDVPLLESTDYRLPSKGYHNEFGFAVRPETIPVGSFAAIEGYYAEDGNFHHFAVEAGGGELVDANTPQSSIIRAGCSVGGRLEVQGASYLPAANTVEIYNALTGFYFGSIRTTVDLVQPDFGTYRFRVNVNEGEPNTDGACPSEVQAVTLVNRTVATAGVDGVTAGGGGGGEPPPPTDEPPVAVDDAATVFVGLATEVHLTLNDSDPNGNIDPTTVQILNVPAGLAVQNQGNGDVLVTAAATGIYAFNYTVADTTGLVSNTGTVTITAQAVSMDMVDITRANYRARGSRWDLRGTTNQPNQIVTVTLIRTNEAIATVTTDATGSWQVDVRNSPVRATEGDIVRADSNGGGRDEMAVNFVVR